MTMATVATIGMRLAGPKMSETDVSTTRAATALLSQKKLTVLQQVVMEGWREAASSNSYFIPV